MSNRVELEVSMSPEVEDCLPVGSQSTPMRAVENIASEIASTSIPVLITGESGTGKKELARWIHQSSRSTDKALLSIACATLTPETITSQLRLHDRKEPSVGTVVFDDVADLARDCQHRLLHVLPDDDAVPQPERLAARVISTTSENLEDEVRTGRFRDDLYYRLSGVCLRIPPLRDRREDIPLLVGQMLTKHSARLKKQLPVLSELSMERLMEHSWPGNVRELENTVMKIVALDERIALADLAKAPVAPRTTHSIGNERSLKSAARAASQAAEREMILKTLTRTQWNRKRAAQELRVSYKSLLYKIKQIGLPGPGSR